MAAELLRLLISRLEDAEIPYALGGSIASMVYGEPRATLDIDVVVTLDASTAERIVESFPAPEFYLSAERVAVVAERGGTFNAIHPASGFKIDFFVASDPIEERQLAGRLRRVVLPGVSGWCSPPEELIAKKLEYFRDGGSTKHLRDIRSMSRSRGKPSIWHDWKHWSASCARGRMAGSARGMRTGRWARAPVGRVVPLGLRALPSPRSRPGDRTRGFR